MLLLLLPGLRVQYEYRIHVTGFVFDLMWGLLRSCQGLYSHQAVWLAGGTGTDPTGEYSHLLMLLAYACCYCWYGNQLGVCLGDGTCMFRLLASRG